MEVSTTPIDEKPKNKFVYTHEWYLEHKDVINRRNRESYHKNKPPLKEKKTPIFNRKEYISEYRKNNMDKPYYQYDAEYQKAYREKKKLEKQQTV